MKTVIKINYKCRENLIISVVQRAISNIRIKDEPIKQVKTIEYLESRITEGEKAQLI